MTRLSSHLPHLPRLCRLDRLSVRSKRLAAALAAVLLTLSLVTLPLFAAANHLDTNGDPPQELTTDTACLLIPAAL